MWGWLEPYVIGDAATGVTGLHFAFGVPVGVIGGAALIVSVAAAAGVYSWRRLERVSNRPRVVLTALRTFVVALVLFLVLDPSFVGHLVRPGEQVVALLFDDSRSMQITGADGQTRGSRMLAAYATAGTPLEQSLLERFQLVRYGVGIGAERIERVDTLRFEQPVSNLTGSIEGAIADLSGADVAAVVLYSDGVHQAADAAALDAVKATGVPVFTVGADTAGAWRDIELASLSVKRSNFDKSPVVATMRVAATGLDGESVVAEVLEGERVVASQAVTMTGDAAHELRLEFIPTRQEWVIYEARVRHGSASEPGTRAVDTAADPENDRIGQNNARGFLVDNREKEYRVLYLSGSPTWENKFYRRAMEADKQLRVTSLIRISKAEKQFVFRGRGSGVGSMTNPLFQGFNEKLTDQPRYDEAVYLRLGTAESELTTGYPDEPDALYPYQLIIWGDIEHNFFSSAQLELTRDFVLKRGGTLLLMGGARSFAEGGFGNTLVDAMLPIVLRAAKSGSRVESAMEPFAVEPTADGIYSGAWMLDPSPESNRQLWEDLSGLYGLNSFALTRAGASVMATVNAPNKDYDGQPFFAIQRYGEGRCAVVATGETWPWHMRTEDGDTRYERLWRQLTRTLVDGVPEPIQLRTKSDAYPAGDEATLEFLVRDKRFTPREALQMTMTMTTASGKTQALDVDESIQESGVYTAQFTPEETGAYAISLSAVDDAGEVVGRLDERLTVAPDMREYHDAQYDEAFLRLLAEPTGGRFTELDGMASLADLISARAVPAPDSDLYRWHLWYWPPFLWALILMLSVEWYLRRKKGQA